MSIFDKPKHDEAGQVQTGSIHDLVAWFHRRREEFIRRQTDVDETLERMFDIMTDIGAKAGVIDASKVAVSLNQPEGSGG